MCKIKHQQQLHIDVCEVRAVMLSSSSINIELQMRCQQPIHSRPTSSWSNGDAGVEVMRDGRIPPINV